LDNSNPNLVSNNENEAGDLSDDAKNLNHEELVQQSIDEVKQLGFNSPAFWQRIEIKTEPLIVPEVLAWAVAEFAKLQDKDNSRRVLQIIYERYNKIIQNAITYNVYMKSTSPDKRAEMRDEITQYSWENLITRLTKAALNDRLFSRFTLTLTMMVKGDCKTVFYQDSGPVAVKTNHVEKLDASGKPYQYQEKVYPARNTQKSWDAPLGQIDTDHEKFTLANSVADSSFEAQMNYDELLDALKSRLTESQLQILLLMADGISNSEIARVVGRDRGTVARHWAEIQRIAQEVLDEKSRPASS